MAAKNLIGVSKLQRTITLKELQNLVKGASKSMPGFNPVPNALFAWFIHTSLIAEEEEKLEIVRAFILVLFNGLLKRTMTRPKEWTKAEVCCLFKSGDPEDPNNYRPIALLASLYKLYTSVLTQRLSDFNEINEVCTLSQRGGRPAASTYQLVSTLVSLNGPGPRLPASTVVSSRHHPSRLGSAFSTS